MLNRLALAALALTLACPALAQEPKATDAGSFYGGYMWRQFFVQGARDVDGAYSMDSGDIWGGRIVGGLGFGRVGLLARVDVSGLKDQFNPQDPSTFQTLEGYVGVHAVLAFRSGFHVGPVAVVGSMMAMDDTVSSEWRGVGVNLAGGGLRVAGHGSELELLAVGTRNYLVGDPTVRIALVVHARLTERLYAVGDALSGQDGFVRAGIAVRAF